MRISFGFSPFTMQMGQGRTADPDNRGVLDRKMDRTRNNLRVRPEQMGRQRNPADESFDGQHFLIMLTALHAT